MEGVISINRKKRLEAFVKFPDRKDLPDIYIEGDRNRNRALEGDVVVVELLPLDQWRVNSRQMKEESVNFGVDKLATEDHLLWAPTAIPSADSSDVSAAAATAATAPPPLPVKSGSALHMLQQRQLNSDGQPLQPAGKVVAIRKRAEHNFFGSLQRPSSCVLGKPLPSSMSYVLLTPRDPRYPYVVIPRNMLPPAFERDPLAQPENLYKCKIAKWLNTSRSPLGIMQQAVGQCGDLSIETAAIMEEHLVRHDAFSDEVLACVKKYAENWKPSAKELSLRRDLRDWCIFSIDPTTARDLDDAVSVTLLADGTYEVGVHIADVSYFVRPGTALDKEALMRATSVYMTQMVVPMLPHILCNKVCSLEAKVERLAFSAVWYMKGDGSLIKTKKPWFGRTIIRSCCQLDYGTAQGLITGDIDPTSGTGMDKWEKARRPSTDCKYSLLDIQTKVQQLNSIATRRRKRRVDSGALTLNSVQLSFGFDKDRLNPCSVCKYPIKDSNRLIEEYMLLANFLVAQELIVRTGELAFLRNHPAPKPSGLANLFTWAEEQGYLRKENTPETPKEFQRWFRDLRQKIPANERALLDHMVMLPMCQATYISAGSCSPKEWHHYALSIPYYTHFTSPIRRYADIMVHRLLAHALELPGTGTHKTVADTDAASAGAVSSLPLMRDFYVGPDEVTNIANQCTEKKTNADNAQMASEKITLWVYLMTKNAAKAKPSHASSAAASASASSAASARGRMEAEAMVMSVGPKYISVLATEYGVEGKLYVDKHRNNHACDIAYDEISECAHIHFVNTGAKGTVKVRSRLRVIIRPDNRPPNLNFELVKNSVGH